MVTVAVSHIVIFDAIKQFQNNVCNNILCLKKDWNKKASLHLPQRAKQSSLRTCKIMLKVGGLTAFQSY